jgi:phospholipid/cholesterol/gamma-HCH transport system permease protein
MVGALFRGALGVHDGVAPVAGVGLEPGAVDARIRREEPVRTEIDALATAGISPVQFLVLPRVLALVLMTPLLTIYANLFGIAGGCLVAVTMLDLSVTAYVVRIIQVVTVVDFAMGLIRASVFGVLIAMAGCLRGMQCGRTASAVGLAATSAVVTSIVLIIVADGLLSVIFHVIRL